MNICVIFFVFFFIFLLSFGETNGVYGELIYNKHEEWLKKNYRNKLDNGDSPLPSYRIRIQCFDYFIVVCATDFSPLSKKRQQWNKNAADMEKGKKSER